MNVEQTIFTIKNLPIKESILLQGEHGIGKSQVVFQCARELSKEKGVPFQVIDLRTSQKEVGDLVGMPRFMDNFETKFKTFVDGEITEQKEKRDNVTVFSPPTFFPVDKDSHGFIFLDEINRGSKEMQQAVFELALDRRLNFMDLPKNWRVISAINEDADTYDVSDLDPALLDRFHVINFKPTVKDWLKYAKDNEVHDSIIKYITKFESSLDVPKEKESGKVYQSRRSWVKLSNTIKQLEVNEIDLVNDSKHEKYFHLLCRGYIGALSISFTDFIKKDYMVFKATDFINKMNKKLSDKMKNSDITEQGFYNDLILDHIKNNIKNLNAKQKKNIIVYLNSVHKEAIANFWKTFIRENNEVAKKWYSKDKELQDIIINTLYEKKAMA